MIFDHILSKQPVLCIPDSQSPSRRRIIVWYVRFAKLFYACSFRLREISAENVFVASAEMFTNI